MAKSSKHAYIGIDVGGTKSLFALFNHRFEVLAQEKFRSHPEKGGAKAFTQLLETAIRKLLRSARKHGLVVKFVGVGCAGDIDMKRGVVRHSPNLGFLDGYSFRDRLEKLTGASPASERVKLRARRVAVREPAAWVPATQRDSLPAHPVGTTSPVAKLAR